ncbi:ATP-binding protein [Actinoplanes sp. TFC3]|uniref:ATP-binding protein n=1 Tax=Actinoplanes sp. TFC3 TaxID=1710355 RepID=UPI00082FA4DD|nr:ATP-binding protein [Actinoplanes sp. TFC3]
MSVRAALTRTAVFALLYAVATFAGRLTIMDGTSLSIVWPAAGIAVVWFCAQRHSPVRWADALALAAVTMVINMLTGASAALAGMFVIANLIQAGLFGYLMNRWRPHLWGAGGSESLRSPRDLWALLSAAFCATVAGAAIGPSGVWLFTGHYSWSATAVWMARNTASMLLIGAVGLCFGHALAAYLTRHNGSLAGWPRAVVAALRRTPRLRILEYAAMAACSAAAYIVSFGLTSDLPISFTLIGLTVWGATRLSTPFVVLHDMAVGVIAVLFTLHDNGPFAHIGSLPLRAMVVQLFVAMVAVVGLALALGRDERQALLRELDADKAALAREKEYAARQAQLMNTIIDSMGDGLSVITADGDVVLRNPAMSRLLGGRTSPGNRITTNGYYGLYNLDGSPIRIEATAYARVIAGDNVENHDVLIRNPDVPEGRIVSVSAARLDYHGRPSAVLLMHDVTAERRHRDELAGFAGVVAHDLLNPLTAVEGWAGTATEALTEAPGHPATTAALGSLVRVSRAAARMRGLITDLLAYTTARDAALATTSIDLDKLVADIAAIRTDSALAAGQAAPVFAIGHLGSVAADPTLTRQLLDNLIGNAIKYTAAGVTPHLVVDACELSGMRQVSIADNGIGIPAGQHDAIFDNFHRAHRTAGHPGTGLGLGICKRIVQRHGGTITATDDPAGGSRFTFTLPLPAPAQPRALQTTAA